MFSLETLNQQGGPFPPVSFPVFFFRLYGGTNSGDNTDDVGLVVPKVGVDSP